MWVLHKCSSGRLWRSSKYGREVSDLQWEKGTLKYENYILLTFSIYVLIKLLTLKVSEVTSTNTVIFTTVKFLIGAVVFSFYWPSMTNSYPNTVLSLWCKKNFYAPLLHLSCSSSSWPAWARPWWWSRPCSCPWRWRPAGCAHPGTGNPCSGVQIST